MVVRNDEPKEKHIDSRPIKEKLWEEFEKMPDSIATLAYMYARGYQISGVDITKEWKNAVMNNQVIEDIYRRGYEDALKDIEEKKRRDFYHKVIRDLKKGEYE